MAVLQTNLEFSKRKEDNCCYVPNNNNKIALLGNDFIDYCELTHAFNGNFIAHAFDEDSYYSNSIGAISKSELNSLVTEALEYNTLQS